MKNTIKKALIVFLEDLLKERSNSDLQKAVSELKKDKTQIPPTNQGKYQISCFIRLLFTQDPERMTPENKKRLNSLAKALKLDEALDKTINQQPKQR